MRWMLAAALLIAPAAQAETWLATVDQYAGPTSPIGRQYMELFKSDAPWGAGVQIFKTSTQFLHQASDSEITTLLTALRTRHVALAMEGLLLVESERCGRGVESYGGKGAVLKVAERVERLGGEIAYVTMDEPVWYGHVVTGGRHCHDSIESIAQQMAENVRALKAAFPAIKFGDTEPINGDKTAGRIDAMLQFATAFKVATGEPISFIHADVTWQSPWHDQLAEWKARTHAAGLKFGVIFNGAPTDANDDAWVRRAADRYRAVMNDPAIAPDDAILQSWMPLPGVGAMMRLANEIGRGR